LYLLGHMALGYLFAWVVARGRRQTLVVWVALTAAVLPDFDLLFGGFGLAHETYTHSLVVWAPMVLLLVTWRSGSLPYVAALLQHIVVGDFLIGSIPLLLPLSGAGFGLGLGMPSMPDALIEFSSLLIMVVVMVRSGDLRRLMSGSREGALMVVPLVSMVGLTWFAENGWAPSVAEGVVRLFSYGFSTDALIIVSVGQILIEGLMVAAVLMAALALLRTRANGIEVQSLSIFRVALVNKLSLSLSCLDSSLSV